MLVMVLILVQRASRSLHKLKALSLFVVAGSGDLFPRSETIPG